MRRLLGLLFLGAFFLTGSSLAAADTGDMLRLATFRCDVTPPVGQPLFTCEPIEKIESPLEAKGVVIESGRDRYVLCAVDWCTLGGGSYNSFREKIAAAAGTDPSRVALQTVHQHTAPMVDGDGQKLLAAVGAAKLHLDPAVLEDIEKRLADEVKKSLDRLEPFDRIGTGQAKVEQVASCRRAINAEGKVVSRMSACKHPNIRALPEGTIDPYLKTITFARGEKPLARLHYYATHPQTSYGDGRISRDFVGDVREQIERKEGVFQVYFTGCGGDVTVGKYNDGSRECRDELTRRLLAGVEASIAATKYAPAEEVSWRTRKVLLPVRTDAGFAVEDCRKLLDDPAASPVLRLYKGAIRAAFMEREDKSLEISCLRIGKANIVNLPGEPFLCFQLYAQKQRPDEFTAVAGYGEGGPGYLCHEKALGEGGYEPTSSNVKPESEKLLKKAIATLLDIESK